MKPRAALAAGLLVLAGSALQPALAVEPLPLDTVELARGVEAFSGHYGAYMNGFSVGVLDLEVAPAKKKRRAITLHTDIAIGPVEIDEEQTILVDRDWGLVSVHEKRTGTQGDVLTTAQVSKSGDLTVTTQRHGAEEEYSLPAEGLVAFSTYRHLLANVPVAQGEARILQLVTPSSYTVDEVVATWVGPESVRIRGQSTPATRIDVAKAGVVSEVLWVADGHLLVAQDRVSGLLLIHGTAEEVRQDLPEVADPVARSVRDSLTVVLVAMTSGNGELLDKVVDYGAMLERAREQGGEAGPTTVEEAREQMHGAMDQSSSGLTKEEARSATTLFTVEVEGERARAWMPTDQDTVFELVDKSGVWKLFWIERPE